MSTQSLKFEIIDRKIFNGKSEDEVQKLIEKRLVNLNTGDMVIMSSFDRTKQKQEHLNDSKFQVVYSVNSEKYLTDLKAENSAIPVEITKKLTQQNPKLNITKSYTLLYQLGLKEYKNCFKSIELDFKTHLDYLPDDLNLELVVRTHGKLYYFFNPPTDDVNNNSNFIKLDQNLYVSMKCDLKMDELEIETEIEVDEDAQNETITLDESQLNESNFPDEQRDPEVEDFAKHFKNIYENQFRNYLKNLKPGESLNATSLPTKKYNKDTYDEDSAESTSLVFYFDKLELDENGNINMVVVNSFDKTEICFFTPYLCKEYGPYFKTNLFCSFYNVGRSKDNEAAHFFLDLPIDLYNLIE